MIDITVKKKIPLKQIFLIIAIFIVAGVVFFFLSRSIYFKIKNPDLITQAKQEWQNQQYEKVYELTSKIREKDFFNSSALMYQGYSAFYLALASTDSPIVHNYLDIAINCIRIALQTVRGDARVQLLYMLGKVYFQKNISANYYADLSVKYLEKAKNEGCAATDIFEYLGLSYAALDMTTKSIEAFTEALLLRETDVLKLAIAEQYYKKSDNQSAKPYLYHLKKNSKDSLLILRAENLLGQIYLSEKKYTQAAAEFEDILKKDSHFADAYYNLGLIYELEGNMIKARSQWREALKIEVNHSGALKKMGLL